MTVTLHINRAGPGLSLQDLGRADLISQGISPGGAADRLAILEAAALLGLQTPASAIEMAGMGAEFHVDAPMRFALTGAPMRAFVDDIPVKWDASHVLAPEQTLRIGSATRGMYGYLTFAGDFLTPQWLSSRSTHLVAGIGGLITSGDVFELGDDPAPHTQALNLPAQDRFAGGDLRVMPGPQTALFSPQTRARFFAAEFTRGPRGNRQGVEVLSPDQPFSSENTKSLISDFIIPGDIQLTGTGLPYVLLAECQTIGGYPRIGTVVPDDLPRIAQCPPGGKLRLIELSLEEAEALYITDAERLAQIYKRTSPLYRNPKDIHDLLSYQLISGATAGDDLEQSHDDQNNRSQCGYGRKLWPLANG